MRRLKFSKNNIITYICPYCQSNIKPGTDLITCSLCGTPHHFECWEENKGCTTFGCLNNPLTGKKQDRRQNNASNNENENRVDIGSETISEIERSLSGETTERQELHEETIPCPRCKRGIEAHSVFCKYCGYNLRGSEAEEDNKALLEKKKFEDEFKKRYYSKVSFKRKRFYITLVSICILSLAAAIGMFGIYKHFDIYMSSAEYNVENRVQEWKKAWESRDIDRYSKFLSEDYVYTSPEGKHFDKEQRLKRIEWTFQNYKYIILTLDNIEIKDQSAGKDSITVSFTENYSSDKFNEEGSKILKMKKDSTSTWLVYDERYK